MSPSQRPEWVASLTLFGPIGEPGDAARERLRDRARACAAERHDRHRRRRSRRPGLASSTKLDNPAVAAFVRESHLAPGPGGFRAILRGAGVGEGRRPPAPALPDPPRDRRGRSDRPAEARRRRLRRGSRALSSRFWPRCGHWTPIEQPKECARLASEHIRAHA